MIRLKGMPEHGRKYLSLLYISLTLTTLYSFALYPSLLLAQENNITLTVEASGARPDEGQAIFSLFNSEESFLDEPIVSLTMAVDAAGTAIFILPNLQSGIYAFTVIYDEDSNNELNTGFFGIPKEKVAVSNNPEARFGPPKFADAAFSLSTSTLMSVTLSDVN